MKAILRYQSIDDSRSSISVSPAVFARHLQWLTSGAVTPILLDALELYPLNGPHVVAVTFDGVYANAKPAILALLEAGIPVSLFVVTGHVGGTNAWCATDGSRVPALPLMDWDDIDHLRTLGARIESHTHTHPDLTRLSSAEAIEEEIAQSFRILRTRIEAQPVHLAYPYGAVDARVLVSARRFARWAETDRFRKVRRGCDGMKLPRLDMRYFRSARSLERWGEWPFRLRLVRIRATRAVARRVGQLVGHRF